MSSLVFRKNSVRSYLASQYMFVDDEWLSGCVEYLTENTSNLSETELLSQAREQWLLNDLKIICPGCLPANLKEQHKTELNGQFVLQINAAIDIGTPAYQQYVKLQKINTENVEATTKFEDKIPSHRMIKLYLTDGNQDIAGIEYKPMRNLSCDITPGCKVLLKEPDLNTTVAAPRNTNIPTPHTTMPSSRPEPSPIPEPFETTSRPVARVTSIQVADSLNDDDLDIDELAAIEEQLYNTRDKRHSEELPNPEKKMRIECNDYPEENDFFVEEDDEHIREMEAQFDSTADSKPRTEIKYPIPISHEPYVYIKQINEMRNSEKAGRVIRVKGQIMKLLSKLSVGKDGWSLKCTIVDGTGNIDVDFTSDVLSKLVGISPTEMNQIKREMANNPELKTKAVAALQKAKESLQMLNCIIELTILETPKITCLIPFEDSHAHALKKRLDGSAL